MFPGYYLNELLLKLLARQDPHPALFDAYADTLGALATQAGSGDEAAALRAFELLLLRETGVLPDLAQVTLTAEPLQPAARYTLHAEAGVAARRPRGCRARPGWRWKRRWRTAARRRCARRWRRTPRRCGRLCGPCFTIIWATPLCAHARSGRACSAWPRPHPDEPPRQPGHPARRHPRCRSTSTRWRCCAIRATSAFRAWCARPRCACRPAPTASPCTRGPTSATSAPTTCTTSPALLKDWPQAEYNIEGNPFHNLMDFVRELSAAAAGDLRARQRGPVHHRPRLGPGRRRRAPAAADRRMHAPWACA